MRYKEAEERPIAVNELKKAIEGFRSFVSSQDPKYEHIDAAERAKVTEECDKKEKWINEAIEEQSKLAKDQDPKIRVSQIRAAIPVIIYFILFILFFILILKTITKK